MKFSFLVGAAAALFTVKTETETEAETANASGSGIASFPKIKFNSSYSLEPPPVHPTEYHRFLASDFYFGFASAAVQVEGAAMDDGKSLSIWDTYASIPGKIEDGSKPDVADDEYHLINETIALLKFTGANIYRFSIAWPRIVPGGFRGSDINLIAVVHYNFLIDALIENGITPFVTLYHWVLLKTALIIRICLKYCKIHTGDSWTLNALILTLHISLKNSLACLGIELSTGSLSMNRPLTA